MYSTMKFFFVFLFLGLCYIQINGQTPNQLQPRMPRIKAINKVQIMKKAPAIVGGTTASTGQFPYMVAIILDGSHFCGGTIITKQFILTAAHCAHGTQNFTIYAGTVNWGNSTSRIRYKTTIKIIHANFSSSSLNNDIAVLQLTSNISSTYFSSGQVGLVRLPTQTQASAGTTFNYLLATAVGWGKVNDTSSVSYTLNYVTGMTIINNTQCVSVYGSTTVKSSTLCAFGGGTKNICSGDSGGPLLITESDSKYTQVGITSFTASSTCYSHPSGYARVTSFITWLIHNVPGLIIRA